MLCPLQRNCHALPFIEGLPCSALSENIDSVRRCRSGEDNLVECMVTGKRFPAFYAKAGHLVKCANPNESKVRCRPNTLLLY